MSQPSPTSTADAGAFEQAKVAFFEGLAHLQAGRAAEAEVSFLASLASVPGRVSTLVNLAATRMALQRPADALATADDVLALEPGNSDALLHRATALRLLGRHAESVQAFEAALARQPGWAEGWMNLGLGQLELSRPDAALQALDRALAINDELGQAWSCRGDILRDMGRLQDARHAYERAMALGADVELMRYCLAGCVAEPGQGPSPSTAPRAYVETLFDAYAGDFEQHLVERLRYRAPQVLAAPLSQLHPTPFAAALDLGCGTGLCGPLLRGQVRHLTGVDLSAGMLERASAHGVYDELVHGDIVEHLQQCQRLYDLVVSADVFIYVGDLEPVFAQVARLMPAGGIFCFSAEAAESPVPGYALMSSLRYAHHPDYLRRLAHRHGFDMLSLSEDTVREEQRRPITGLFAHLRRRA